MTRKKTSTLPKGVSLDELERETEKLLALLKNRNPWHSWWNIALLKQVEALRALVDVKTEKRPSKRVFVSEVLNKATEVFGGRKEVRLWLKREALGLDGMTPESLLTTPEGCEKVMTFLVRLEHNVY